MFLSAIFKKIALTTGLNCTRLRLEQLPAYCRAIFSQNYTQTHVVTYTNF